jgi:hypothetical protein
MSGELIKSVKQAVPIKGSPDKNKDSDKEKFQNPSAKKKPEKDKKHIIDTYA